MKLSTILKCGAGGAAAVLGACAALWGAAAYSPAPPLKEGLSFSKMVFDSRGHLLRMSLSTDEKYRIFVPFEAVSQEAVEALLNYEDKYFYRHFGVNPFSVIRAVFTPLAGRRKVGASTITMQVARLRFGLETKTWMGKIFQMWMALRLEAHYTKREILETYFSLAPYGGNIEGIEAASRIYFGIPAQDLNRLEAKALSVIPQNPIGRHPVSGKDFEKAFHRAAPQETEDGIKLEFKGVSDLPFEAPHATTELLKSTEKAAIRSTLRLPVQNMIEALVKRYIARNKEYGLQNASVLLVHAPTSEIHALVGSSDFHNSKISGQVDGTRAKRSPGSTLKPFIYGLAVDQGLIHPWSLLKDVPSSFAGYDPKNFDGQFMGPLPAHAALKGSRNLPAVELTGKLRDPDLYDFLQKAGIVFPKEKEFYGLSLALGGAEMTPREVASLYAMLANGGLFREVSLSKEESGYIEPGIRLLSEEGAFITLDMLQREDLKIGGVPVAAKTGTSNGNRDAWTAGVFGDYVLVVWLGNFDSSSHLSLVGASAAYPLFMEIATALGFEGLIKPRDPLKEFQLNLERIEVCRETGDVDTSLCPGKTVSTFFIPGVSPIKPTGILQKIPVNAETGLRACKLDPKKVRMEVHEFWSPEFIRLFALSGISKKLPPPWEPECAEELGGASHLLPNIVSPKKGVKYFASPAEMSRNYIVLRGETADGKGVLFWYEEDRFLGKSGPGKELLWQPKPGVHKIKAVDSSGRIAERTVVVGEL